MPRRAPLGPALVALCALTALTACNGSPEAGHPNTVPVPTSPSSSPAPSPTSSGPQWTAEEQTAITASKKQYSAARVAIDAALAAPAKADRVKLEGAGNGGTWINTVLEDIVNFQDYGWYETGSTKVLNTQVSAVNLKLQQPQVDLINCIDSSAVIIRSQQTGKPIPIGAGTSKRQKVSSRMVYAPAATGGVKRWWLITEKELGVC
ncbi:hypothetical protein EV645_5806 [Kribbella rubisoli]|uniref:Lipoprotein n=1 Tax=Kribbella rubisoli TaxID=3075929 RepID=A0A4Q7WQJ6_9ACTN|nr:hypothetical protein EV645_5806 [Kribbella rubisoli]